MTLCKKKNQKKKTIERQDLHVAWYHMAIFICMSVSGHREVEGDFQDSVQSPSTTHG